MATMLLNTQIMEKNPESGPAPDNQDVYKPRRKYQAHHKPQGNGKRYTPIEKLAVAALLKAGKSPSEIKRETGMHESSIYNVKHDKKYQIIEAAKVEEIKRSLVGMAYAQAHRAQSFISDEKLEASSALQLMTISAIGIDKGRLMEGLSTENVSIQKDESELDAEIIRKKEELERIRNAKIVNADVITSTEGLARGSTISNATESGI